MATALDSIGDRWWGGPAAPDRERRVVRLPGAVLVLVVSMSVVVGVLTAYVDSVFLPAAFVMVAVVALAARAPRTVVISTLLFLPFLALVRRLTGSYRVAVDPLAVAGPVLAALCLVAMSIGKKAPRRTSLANLVTAMLGLGVLEIFNPAQGGPLVGLVGAGLFVGPLLWFYIGQRIGDVTTLESITRALRIIVVVVAVYGVKQTLFGFGGFETRWIASQRNLYVALGIEDAIRPFSTFSSGAEYSYFLALGTILFTTWSSGMGRVARTLVVLGLLSACFYAGSRGVFVTAVIGCMAIVIVQRVTNLTKALVLCLAAVASGLLLLRLVPLSTDDTVAGAIRNRTLLGLTRPFDPDVSTLGLHVDAFERGVAVGLATPVGRGAAAVNLAGAKLGDTSVAAEHDIPNVLIAYGWPGGVLLVMLLVRVYRVLRTCVRQRRREALGPAVFVLVTFGVWFAGELYAVTGVLWFFLGAIDRLTSGASVEQAPSVPAAT